jgi:hypothetical protein
MKKILILCSNKNMFRETAMRVIQELGMVCTFSEGLTFNFADLNPDYQHWSISDYSKIVFRNEAINTANIFDLTHITKCDAVLMIGPAGRNSHLLAGYAMGMGKQVYCWLTMPQMPDLSYGLFKRVSDNINALGAEIKAYHEEKK